MSVSHIPAGFRALTPYLNLNDADAFITFVKQAFGAEESMRMAAPNGKVAHCELAFADSKLMVSEAMDRPPMPAALFFYVKDCDAVVEKARAAGAEVVSPPQDQFWGDRHALVRDRFGNAWNLVTHIEDVSPEEMERRAKQALAQAAAQQK
jgi:PhnB protein